MQVWLARQLAGGFKRMEGKGKAQDIAAISIEHLAAKGGFISWTARIVSA